MHVKRIVYKIPCIIEPSYSRNSSVGDEKVCRKIQHVLRPMHGYPINESEKLPQSVEMIYKSTDSGWTYFTKGLCLKSNFNGDSYNIKLIIFFMLSRTPTPSVDWKLGQN